MDKLLDFLNYEFPFGDKIHISVKVILILIIALFIASFVLKTLRKLITRKLPQDDKVKFVSVFGYLKWLIYVIIFLFTLHNAGVNVTAIFAASAALLPVCFFRWCQKGI